ncbi:MAG: hypothetical protein ACLUOF_04850 [Ruminococcus sp.]
MLNHFETLCNLCAVSGDEQAVRSYLISVLEKRHDVTWTIDRWAACWWKSVDRIVRHTS